MLTSQTIQDGSGQITITEHDDRGEPEGYFTPQIADCRGFSALNTALTIDMSRDPSSGKGSYRIGTLLLTAQVIDGTGADYVALNVVVMGLVKSAATVIKRIAFGPGASDDLIRFDDQTSFDTIIVQAQQLVNGLPDSTTPVQAMILQATGRFTR